MHLSPLSFSIKTVFLFCTYFLPQFTVSFSHSAVGELVRSCGILCFFYNVLFLTNRPDILWMGPSNWYNLVRLLTEFVEEAFSLQDSTSVAGHGCSVCHTPSVPKNIYLLEDMILDFKRLLLSVLSNIVNMLISKSSFYFHWYSVRAPALYLPPLHNYWRAKRLFLLSRKNMDSLVVRMVLQ